MTIDAWLKQATDELADAMLETPRLDAEIILAHTIGHPRTWLHAHGDKELDVRHSEIANARIDLRLDRVPVAYIIGHKEFYGRRFQVTTHTLIPRPETEQLIELLLEAVPETDAKRLIDVGTGSGCIAVTAKLERPKLHVTGVDQSVAALNIATGNARRHGTEVHFSVSDLLANYPFAPDIVVANLPYVDESWEQSPEIHHEPAEALYAEDDGLRLIERLVAEAARRQPTHGLLLLEADPRQWEAIDADARQHGYSLVSSRQFAHAYIKD